MVGKSSGWKIVDSAAYWRSQSTWRSIRRIGSVPTGGHGGRGVGRRIEREAVDEAPDDRLEPRPTELIDRVRALETADPDGRRGVGQGEAGDSARPDGGEPLSVRAEGLAEPGGGGVGRVGGDRAAPEDGDVVAPAVERERAAVELEGRRAALILGLHLEGGA